MYVCDNIRGESDVSDVHTALSARPLPPPAVSGAARPGPGESRQRKFANSERSAPDTRPYTQGRGHRGWGAQVRGPDIGQNPQPMVGRAFPKMWNFSNGEIIPI